MTSRVAIVVAAGLLALAAPTGAQAQKPADANYFAFAFKG